MSNLVASPNSAASKPPGHDIFCTPENSDFVSKVPYKSLSKTDHEIRLLKILPDSGSGFVECELLPAVSLATVHNQYLALSYCAGSAKDTKPIKVNGVNSNVFANLHHALTRVRDYWETHAELPEFLLWVDQICINQFDLAERSHQVGFMRDIYQSAKRTLVCLSTSETDGEGMRWLAELKERVAQAKIDDITHFITEKSDTEEFAKGLAGFYDIATSPWWGRAWVIQEFMVSTHVTFLYGWYAMPHGDFSEIALRCCRAIIRLYAGEYPKTRLTKQLEGSRYSKDFLWLSRRVKNMLTVRRKESTATDLVRLLLHTRYCRASDRRDKIYSVLGLVNSGYGIMPDYSPENDVPKLLVETTRRIIAFEDSLSILSNLDSPQGILKDRGQLPSWVIDWIHAFLPNATHWDWNQYWNQYWRPKMRYFTDHKITTSTIDASFVEVTHPERPEILTTALRVWAILLDTCLQLIETGSSKVYRGSQHYMISSWRPVQSDHELWILCGAREPFLLTRYSYGYRLLFPVKVINAVVEDGMTEFPQLMDDQGKYDTSKMDWKRITIF